MSRSRPLLAWTLAGLLLDAAALSAAWSLLATSGPHGFALDLYLVMLVLAVTPWWSHVVALPACFGAYGTAPRAVPTLALWGVGFTIGAAIVTPLLGVACVLTFGMLGSLLLTILTGPVPMWGPPETRAWVNILQDAVYTATIFVPVGAGIGGLLGLCRGSAVDKAPCFLPGQVRFRSDVVGGAAAAALAVGTGDIASANPMVGAGGLFGRPLPAPFFVGLGALALLPHLILVGIDLRAGAMSAGNRSLRAPP